MQCIMLFPVWFTYMHICSIWILLIIKSVYFHSSPTYLLLVLRTQGNLPKGGKGDCSHRARPYNALLIFVFRTPHSYIFTVLILFHLSSVPCSLLFLRFSFTPVSPLWRSPFGLAQESKRDDIFPSSFFLFLFFSALNRTIYRSSHSPCEPLHSKPGQGERIKIIWLIFRAVDSAKQLALGVAHVTNTYQCISNSHDRVSLCSEYPQTVCRWQILTVTIFEKCRNEG